jgi:hypothetical protein
MGEATEADYFHTHRGGSSGGSANAGATKRNKGSVVCTCRAGQCSACRVHHQKQPTGPRLSIMSYSLALQLTDLPLRVDLPLTERLDAMQEALTRLLRASAPVGGDGGCEWLHGLCCFLQSRWIG